MYRLSLNPPDLDGALGWTFSPLALHSHALEPKPLPLVNRFLEHVLFITIVINAPQNNIAYPDIFLLTL